MADISQDGIVIRLADISPLMVDPGPGQIHRTREQRITRRQTMGGGWGGAMGSPESSAGGLEYRMATSGATLKM